MTRAVLIMWLNNTNSISHTQEISIFFKKKKKTLSEFLLWASPGPRNKYLSIKTPDLKYNEVFQRNSFILTRSEIFCISLS